jgi:hypothetical protein
MKASHRARGTTAVRRPKRYEKRLRDSYGAGAAEVIAMKLEGTHFLRDAAYSGRLIRREVRMARRDCRIWAWHSA